MVLSGGQRRDWPCFRWGWRFWAERYGDDLGSAKQRAPIFDADVWADTVTAEVSLREYIEYARRAHRQPLDAQKRTPLLYFNGFEAFEEHPELWSWSIEQLAGSIENLNASECRELLGQFGTPPTEEEVAGHVRQYAKLFVAPRGAITRMHQDNHHAHAWLSQVRRCPAQTRRHLAL